MDKKNKFCSKKGFVFILVFAMVFLLCGCCLSHEWVEASCAAPKTCSKCGKTEGEPLEHQWKEATCTAPRTCTDCGETYGVKLSHKFSKEEMQNPNYVEATATFVKTCTTCGEQEERTDTLEKLNDEKAFLMTPEEFSDRFTNMLMDMQHLFGNDQYLSFIDDGSASRTLKMHMCQRVDGNITIPGEFEMRDSNNKLLKPEQRTEAGIIWKVRGTVKGEEQALLAMYSLLRTLDPAMTLDQTPDTAQAWAAIGVLRLRGIEDVLFELDRKGGDTYVISAEVRHVN